MSAFGAKRKPRVIRTLDDDVADLGQSISDRVEQNQDQSQKAQGPIKFARRPAKSSSLRRSVNFNDDEGNGDGGALVSETPTADDGGSGPPVVIRPSGGRSGSAKPKKKKAASRLSFGPGEGTEDDDGQSLVPRKTLGQKALENNAIKKAAPMQSLPTRFLGDDDRPRYSKEYLNELQSATPNAPQNLASLSITDEDIADGDGDVEMALDPSELDGATIVQSSTDIAARPSAGHPAATVMTEGQIRERKERRARRAREADFISLDDGDDEGDGSDGGAGPTTVRISSSKKKPESRLIAEDEDLGEGYDEFVEDGGLSLGRKAEREARRRHRREMADLIQAAAAEEDGGGSGGDSDDSEAERRAAYETAQRRAGMDGLQRHDEDDDGAEGGGPNVIPRMRPLPELGECLQRMRDLVQGLEDEVTSKRKKIVDMEKEREEILQRETEVQGILDQAGAKYQSLAGTGAADVTNLTAQSPLRAVPPGLAPHLPVERGLESLGTTPTLRPDIGDVG